MPISIVDAWPIDVQNLDITNAKILKDGSYQRLVDIVDDPQTDALAGLSPTADTVPYFTSATTAAVTGLTAFARTLLDDPNASTALTTLGVSSYAQTILDDVDAATARATLGLGTIATQAASNVAIAGGSITGITDLAIADGGTGGSTAAAARANLGLDHVVSVKHYGAVGDGVTDDTAAIQAAIDAAYTVYFPPTAGGYLIGGSGSLAIPSNRKLVGDYAQTRIVHSSTGWLFDIRGSYIEIDGFRVDGTASGASVGVFRFRTDLGSIERIRIGNIETDRSAALLADMNSTGTLIEMSVDQVVAKRHRGPGVDLRDAFAYLRMERVTVDYVNSSSKNHVAFRLDNNEGSQWINCDVTGATTDATTTGQTGFRFTNCIAVWMVSCMADSVGAVGFDLTSDCRYFYFSQCVASLCANGGWRTAGANCLQMQLSNCVALGRAGLGYAPANAHGFSFTSTNRVVMTGCEAVVNTGIGIKMDATTRYNVGASRADGNTGRGFEAVNSSSGVVTGTSFDANTVGNVSLGSTLDHVASCVSSAGALFSLTGPGTA